MKKFLFFCVMCICTQFSFAQRYEGNIGASYGFGLNDNVNNMGVTTEHGYRFNNYLFVGAGVGFVKLEQIEDIELDIAYIPLYLNIKGYIWNNRKITPFASFDVGMALREDGGLLITPAIGCSYRLGRRHGLSLSIGYNRVKIHNYAYNSMNLKFAFNF